MYNFYGSQDHLYDRFPWCLIIYTCILVSHTCTQLCVVYVVKEVASFQEAQSMGIWRVIECALELYRPAERNLLVAYKKLELIAVLPENILLKFYKILKNTFPIHFPTFHIHY